MFPCILRYNTSGSVRKMALAIGVIAGCNAFQSHAHAAITLGTAENFAVLGASAVTNTGPTTVVGGLGVSPGTAVTGFPPGVVTGGTIHSDDAASTQAQADAASAYAALAALPVTQDLSGQDLGGLTLTPGVYHFSSVAQLTGMLTLDAQ
jgi:hypothetical protein